MGKDVSFDVVGLPATYATVGERPWKDLLAAGIPAPSMGGREVGLIARFILPTLAPAGKPLDIDNLCEPLLSVLVNRAGWFGGARPNIGWWCASKEEGAEHGCRIAVSSDPTPPLDKRLPVIEETYTGPWARSAKAAEVANWSRNILLAHDHFAPTAALSCYLGFGSDRVNIGKVASGVVKSFIDCLYPILGGGAGRPSDHRIDELTVAKEVQGVAAGAVLLKLWALDRVVSTPLRGRLPASTTAGARVEPLASEDVRRSRTLEAIGNPCRRGSAKYIVCEAALAGLSLEQGRRELDAAKPGSSRKLSDYISDIRSENGLDVGHDDSTMWCRGRIRRR
jgi:hypothetical protein